MGLISRLAPVLAPNFVNEIVRYYSVGLSNLPNDISDDKITAGNLEKAIDTAEELIEQGYNITFDVLGEEAKNQLEVNLFKQFFYDAAEIMKRRSMISKREVEDRKKAGRLNPYTQSVSFSFKPSAFFTEYEEFFQDFTKYGKEEGFSTTIDMEDVEWFVPTISCYRRMLRQFDNIGTVLQTNVDASEVALNELVKIPNARIRLCIGIYNVSKKHGTMDKTPRKERLKESAKKLAINGRYAEIATHDVNIIKELQNWFELEGITPDRYEFQALYHVEPDGLKELHKTLINKGVTVRLYLPFAPSVDAAKQYGFRRTEKNPEMLKIFARKAFEYYLKRGVVR